MASPPSQSTAGGRRRTSSGGSTRLSSTSCRAISRSRTKSSIIRSASTSSSAAYAWKHSINSASRGRASKSFRSRARRGAGSTPSLSATTSMLNPRSSRSLLNLSPKVSTGRTSFSCGSWTTKLTASPEYRETTVPESRMQPAPTALAIDRRE